MTEPQYRARETGIRIDPAGMANNRIENNTIHQPREIAIADLLDENGEIPRYTSVSNAYVVGPAVLVASSDTVIGYGHFDTTCEVRKSVPAEEIPADAIMLRTVAFMGCRFEDVTLVIPEGLSAIVETETWTTNYVQQRWVGKPREPSLWQRVLGRIQTK